MKSYKQERIGPVAQKILLLLLGGAALLLAGGRPGGVFRVIKGVKHDWDKINQRSLREAIKRLYQSNLIDYQENNDGIVKMVLSKNGKKRALQYDLDKMKIVKPSKWDSLWRIVIFDIPESKKKARDALSLKMKTIGLKPIQKSVFIYPYDCHNEIEFISELFEVRPYVRFIVAKDIDIALDLKNQFKL